MPGLVWSPQVVPQGGGTPVPLPTRTFLAEVRDGLDQVENKAPGTPGSFIAGESRQALAAALRFEVDGATPAAQEAALIGLNTAFRAEASNHEFTLYLYYDAAAAVGIGFDRCTLLPDGFRAGRSQYVGTAQAYVPSPWQVEVRFKAQATLNWTAAFANKIDSGETTYGAPQGPGDVVLSGLVVRGDVYVQTADGSVTGAKITGATGAFETTGAIRQVPSLP